MSSSLSPLDRLSSLEQREEGGKEREKEGRLAPEKEAGHERDLEGVEGAVFPISVLPQTSHEGRFSHISLDVRTVL